MESTLRGSRLPTLDNRRSACPPGPLRRQLKRLLRAGTFGLLAMNTPAALAQSATEDGTPEASSRERIDEDSRTTVIVTGNRASLASAQAVKRDKLEIVDSVVADDIIKLPDFSVTDALQRVTGVQITQDRGEGANVTIRGLTQMETTLNGRELFTAGSGRTLNFDDIPAEMVSGIDVYKTSSANQVEGGVGGTVDLRTHRPFDFRGPEIVGSGRLLDDDLADRYGRQFSALASDRWETPRLGEFGALVNVSYQKRGWREDQKSEGNPVARTDLIPGSTVIAPNGTSETTSIGERERTAASIVLQWRPSDALEFYAEGNYSKFKTIQNSYQINVTASPGFAAGSPTLFPGTNDLKSITWTNAPVSILSFARDTVDRTRQEAVGGTWTGGPVTLKADLSYTESFNSLFFSGPFLAGTAANFTQDLSTRIPGSAVTGTDLLDPANISYTGIAYRTQAFDGDLTTARFDGEYELPGGFFNTLLAGVRYARRSATDAPGLIVADADLTGVSAASKPGFVMPNPYGNFFPGGGPSIRNFIVGNLDEARNAVGLRNAFGITAPIPASNPLGIWHIGEETEAGYLMAKFKGERLPLDGNIGLRVVSTQESVSGNQSVPTTGAVAPIDLNRSYTDFLPSLNLRYLLTEDLYLRAAVSKTVTRPNFDQLSPSLTLIRNSITPSLNQGTAGNPGLKPVRADNFDVAVEKYFAPTTSIYLTGFVKKVDGFVETVSSPEIHDGAAYQVSRPQNGAAGNIRGFEVGYQEFFDFLPGWLRGFGVQANYTYVDSANPDQISGESVPLQNLSKHSCNLVGMYEMGGVSARLAYNWRSKFLSSVSNIVSVGSLPIYTDAYGWLDASVSYRISDRITLSVEGTNLLGTVRNSYYGVKTRPQSALADDTQISGTATIRF
jgi:TonB-dependent receptor